VVNCNYRPNSSGFRGISNRLLAERFGTLGRMTPTIERPVVVLTPRELGARWKMSAERIAALIRSGALKAFNVAPGNGRRWRIPLEAVLEFEERRRCPASPAPRRRADADIIEFFP
jgi:hypothetical protein